MQELRTISTQFEDDIYLKQFIEAYKHRSTPLQGKNTSSEFVIVDISDINVHLQTFQLDGLIRHNIYWLDGRVDEWFEQ